VSAPSIHELEKHNQELEKLIQFLQQEVETLKNDVRELQRENTYMKTLMETVNRSTTTLIVAVKGDTDYKRKGLVDDIRELSDMVKGMKAEIDGFTTLKNKGVAILGLLSLVGTGGITWLAHLIWSYLKQAK
jgi:chromosome segregation ATPase